MRTRSIFIPPALALAGALALGACSQGPQFQSTATGAAHGPATSVAPDSTVPDPGATDPSTTDTTAATTPPVQVDAPAPTPAVTAPTPPAPAPKPPTGGQTNPPSGGGGGGGGGGNPNPVVTSASGPGTIMCQSTFDTTETFTAHYTVSHAKYVEYLAPGSLRPGGTNAGSPIMFTYDCSKASETFKIRAFNEYNGMDSKDPSPYVSFTVTRKLPMP